MGGAGVPALPTPLPPTNSLSVTDHFTGPGQNGGPIRTVASARPLSPSGLARPGARSPTVHAAAPNFAGTRQVSSEAPGTAGPGNLLVLALGRSELMTAPGGPARGLRLPGDPGPGAGLRARGRPGRRPGPGTELPRTRAHC
eukprot:767005-Hanusia_phi.AAC.2